MGVERFRSIEEMNAAPVRGRAPAGFERFLRHCARYGSLAPRPRPRGVFKFRSLEEAQRARLSGRSGDPADGPSSRSDVGVD
jgi:hypothetical protein